MGMTRDRMQSDYVLQWKFAPIKINASGDTREGILSNPMALSLLIIQMCGGVLWLCMFHFLCLYHRSGNFRVMKLLCDKLENIW